MKEVLYKKEFTQHRTTLYKDTNVFPPKVTFEDDVFGIVIDDTPKRYHPKYRQYDFLSQFDDEETYLENYGNPLATITLERNTVIIEKYDGKVVFKLFRYHLYREVGKPYFKKSTSVNYIGFNTKDNSFYRGKIQNYHKKRKAVKTMRKNIFYHNPVNDFKVLLKSSVSNFLTDGRIYTLEPEIVTKTIDEMFSVFLANLPIKNDGTTFESIDDIIYKLYLDRNGIKYSNNWQVFRNMFPQPNKRHLKKNKFKYIDSFMMVNGLSGDKVKKALHKVTLGVCDSQSLIAAYEVFGKNFIMSCDDEIILKILESNLSHIRYNISDENLELLQRRQKDKQNAFEIYKICLDGDMNASTFVDHLKFYFKLTRLENVRWESNDYKSFMDEHVLWAERYDFYNKGKFHRIYPHSFKEEVERPILGVEPVYPKLLINTNEYNEESLSQSNCVKTYIKKAHSVIISLRRGSEDSKERATIEYQILVDSDSDKYSLKRVQSLGRFNNRLDDSWDVILFLLDHRINDLVDKKIFGLPEGVLEFGPKQIYTKLKPEENSVMMVGGDFKKYRRLVWDEDINVSVSDRFNGLLNDIDNLPFI